MKLGIKDLLRKLISNDVDPEPDKPAAEPPKEQHPPIALCSPYAFPAQWQAELDKPCYCGLPAIWLDFYNTGGEVTAVGTCQHHRGVAQWRHEDDGPVQAFWDPCRMCPNEKEWDICLGHIVVGDNLHTIIRKRGTGYV